MEKSFEWSTPGSVPGPILFLIYINDLPERISCSIKMFADDTKLYSPITQPGDKDCLQKIYWTFVDGQPSGKYPSMLRNAKICT